MMLFFYDTLPLPCLIFAVLAIGYCWGAAKERFSLAYRRAWRGFHWIVLVLWLAVFASVTTLSRSPAAVREIILRPFWSYRVAFIQGSYDLFMEIVLNMLMFLPLGVVLGELLPPGKRFWALPICLGVSICGEIAQSIFLLGLCETDDVISNTFGAAVGIVFSVLAPRLTSVIHEEFQKCLNTRR